MTYGHFFTSFSEIYSFIIIHQFWSEQFFLFHTVMASYVTKSKSVTVNPEYCGWLKFRGVTIFVVFVEGPIHEFQYPRNGNCLYEL